MRTQEEKELLLQDLCARLPYGVKCAYLNTKNELKVGELLTVWCKEKRVFIDKLSIDYDGCDCIGVIPYLFPLSSMTKEQKVELLEIVVGKEGSKYFKVLSDGSICSTDAKEQDLNNFVMHIVNFDRKTTASYIDWLNKNHYDYRGLIGKGLALDATNLNIY